MDIHDLMYAHIMLSLHCADVKVLSNSDHNQSIRVEGLGTRHPRLHSLLQNVAGFTRMTVGLHYRAPPVFPNHSQGSPSLLKEPEALAIGDV